MTAPPLPRRPPELLDELVEEILLRVPPDDPACLARAAVVCKRWCRLVMEPGFRRRFREFHRTPPLLGFVVGRHLFGTTSDFLPRSSFRPPDPGLGSYWPLDARHGRILLFYHHVNGGIHWYDPGCFTITSKDLIIWTPSTGDVLRLPNLELRASCRSIIAMAAALLCTAPGCDHIECPCPKHYGGAFSVILVCGDKFGRFTYAYVYSTQDDQWSETATIELPGSLAQICSSAALARNALYFHLEENRGILEYNLSKKQLSVIELPPICSECTDIVLMTVEEDDALGFAMVHDFSLCIWLRESAPARSSGWTWTQHRVVDIKSFLPVPALSSALCILAAAYSVGVFVIWTGDAGLLAIDLKSSQATKLCDDDNFVNIIPYMSFCTPGLPIAFCSSWQS